ncbi:MAG TPA: Nudix family hydrolase [Burkholderiales bacterium]|nr:Nudix family hydrolase [Burkholderiales bacterium]
MRAPHGAYRESIPLSASRPRVLVAAAVIVRADHAFLLAQRPAGKPYAGYWEFPGGKVEPGESAERALARELHEELGIDVVRAYPWLTRDYDYEHAAVRLQFFRVVDWRGEPHGRENQGFAWQSIGALTVSPVLPANGPILSALALPYVYGITHAAEAGCEQFMRRLEHALQRGLRLVQVREKSLAEPQLIEFASGVTRLAHRYGARVLVNGTVAAAERAHADGVHLTATALMQLEKRPDCALVGASCHDESELRQAVAINADFVVLGPVQPTPSHPGAPTLGWQRLARMVTGYPLPVYALGGMRNEDLTQAWQAGAHGIAMMRNVWGVELRKA